MNNYTKGEWEVKKLPITGGLAIYGGNELIAAGVEEANAQLIASAPDLYEACLSAHRWFFQGRTGDYRIIGRQLEEALAKADKK